MINYLSHMFKARNNLIGFIQALHVIGAETEIQLCLLAKILLLFTLQVVRLPGLQRAASQFLEVSGNSKVTVLLFFCI